MKESVSDLIAKAKESGADAEWLAKFPADPYLGEVSWTDFALGARDDLCVVGDASQTIYSFAGADARFLLDFKRTYPNATLVRLEHNYRSSPIVLGSGSAAPAIQPAIVARFHGRKMERPAYQPPATSNLPSRAMCALVRAKASSVRR